MLERKKRFETYAVRRVLIVGIVCLLIQNIAKGQDRDVHRFQKLFIYNFSKFIKWPENYKEGDFVIGVLGDAPIKKHLDQMASEKKAGAQNFVIKTFKSATEITKCHILYIPSRKSGTLPDCIAKVKNTATLIITEKPGMGKVGSSINFLIVDGKPRFELNRQVIDDSNLRVSSELTKLAILI
ncbi:YfiR family protein [Fulvivirgaceae bacterium BMA10]|uniref:YfiR family protein n=1 Tax=Splendidivirga corallicola TaxID=3051826 RepID=A0ABT8KNP3_9BACT|nr:YfiR family protein [Fulvivirgaceae bacterium BMA10]